MSNNDLVSIIIRTKDRLSLLPRAIESVYSQTYNNIEIIVINDGGENVSSVIDHFMNIKLSGNLKRNIILINNKSSVFRADAGNIGLEMATGKYLAFLDDDDYFYTDHIEVHVSSLKTSKKKVSISKVVESVEERIDSKYVEKHRFYHFPSEINRISFHFFENYFPFNSILFDRVVLEKVKKLDSKLFVLEDWDFLIRLHLNYEFEIIDKVTAVYTTRYGSSNIRMDNDHKKTWRDSFAYIQNKYRETYMNSEIAIPISEVSNFLTRHAVEWYALTKENEYLRDSWAYKLYTSKLYSKLKIIGKMFKLTRG